MIGENLTITFKQNIFDTCLNILIEKSNTLNTVLLELTDELNLLEPYITKETKEDSTMVYSKKEFSDDEFSDNEMKLLDEILNRFKYCSANELINFTHKKNSPWYNTALKNGVLELLESGKMTTTNIEINLSEMIADDKDKLGLYNSHKAFLIQSKNLKS